MQRQLFGLVLGLVIAGAAVALVPNESITGTKTETASPTKSATDTSQPTAAKPSPTVVVTAEADKKWRAKGYKPVVRHGETLYCRRETVLGSHFESNICRTPTDLEAAERSGQFYLEQNQHVGVPPKR
jgi:hypothetical protein